MSEPQSFKIQYTVLRLGRGAWTLPSVPPVTGTEEGHFLLPHFRRHSRVLTTAERFALPLTLSWHVLDFRQSTFETVRRRRSREETRQTQRRSTEEHEFVYVHIRVRVCLHTMCTRVYPCGNMCVHTFLCACICEYVRLCVRLRCPWTQEYKM